MEGDILSTAWGLQSCLTPVTTSIALKFGRASGLCVINEVNRKPLCTRVIEFEGSESRGAFPEAVWQRR